MPHSLRAKLSGLRYKGILEDKDYKRLCHALDLEKAEQEPCDDAISRKDIQDYIAKYLSQYLYEDVRQAVEAIDAYIGDMPSVTQKSGKWIEKDGWDGDVYYECSVCGEPFCLIEGTPTDNMYNYCPNCGAKMVEPQESEEISERNMKMWEELFKAESEVGNE